MDVSISDRHGTRSNTAHYRIFNKETQEKMGNKIFKNNLRGTKTETRKAEIGTIEYQIA